MKYGGSVSFGAAISAISHRREVQMALGSVHDRAASLTGLICGLINTPEAPTSRAPRDLRPGGSAAGYAQIMMRARSLSHPPGRDCIICANQITSRAINLVC